MWLVGRRKRDPYRLGFGDRAEFVVPLLIGVLIVVVLILFVLLPHGRPY